MDKHYDFKVFEEEVLGLWERGRYFNRETGKKFSLVMPLPNVTGRLHIGHALNNTLQDILVRMKRMDGFEIMWVPGTDHAGIATQHVVDKKLSKEGKNSRAMTREAFIEEVWKWKAEYGRVIVGQLKNLGCSCNWDKERFTLDEKFCKLVRGTFVEMYRRDLIYRGKYITNWCCRCRTVLADEEVEQEDVKGVMYYIRYMFEGEPEVSGKYIVIATTRPETLFGDSAVGVNPGCADADLKGKRCIVPIVRRSVPIIMDKLILPTVGTGMIKITPSMDKLDYKLAQKHKLDVIEILDKDNALLKEWEIYGYSGKIGGMREKIVAALDKLGLLEKIEECDTKEKCCYRCKGGIEYSVSDQFYVRMGPLGEKIKGTDSKFYPEHQKNIFDSWLNNITDWCISRQIVWGHPIPVAYCLDCNHINVSEADLTKCEKCSSVSLRKETDVLDTWFSSWLWSFGVFDEVDSKKYFPLDVVVTGSDILFFWIIKMMMASVEFKGVMPFKDIFFAWSDKGQRWSQNGKDAGQRDRPE
ncbi:MAG: valine--tRNA ligase [Hyperionvirus sp.]|uniref:valine--tRNA ligase n=1 Tax=Hyperionvirus sp. TaxID=2487770 RepID=A0A3G5A9A1_9VIRU|nr:MAG: valine--tRNA ligase [Hyperionvirus sp.]